MEGALEGVSGGRDVEGGVTAVEGGVGGAADVARFAVDSGLVSPPETSGTLGIDVSVEAWTTGLLRTLFPGCEWRGTAA